MDQAALGIGHQRSEELRYVTQHFDDLRGLRMTPIWLLYAMFPFIRPRHIAAHLLIPASLVAVFLLYLWLRGIERWCNHRDGVVVKPARAERATYGRRRFILSLGIAQIGLVLIRLILPGPLPGAIATQLPLITSTLLLPRCMDSVPEHGIVRVRLWLYCAAAAVLCPLTNLSLFWKPRVVLTLELFASMLLLLSLYDQWLLERILRPNDDRGEQVCDA
jgi:hypothetical protein